MLVPGISREKSGFFLSRLLLRPCLASAYILAASSSTAASLSSDLSFYNWDTQHSTSNESPNFQILPDHEQGLLFKNKRDRKARRPCQGPLGTHRALTLPQVLSVDPRSEPGDNSKRLEAVRRLRRMAIVAADAFRCQPQSTSRQGTAGLPPDGLCCRPANAKVVIFDHMTRKKS